LEHWQYKYDDEFVRIQGGYKTEHYYIIPARCPKLKDNLCEIYESRPRFCRDWPGTYEECNHQWIKEFGCKFFED
jgi:Fe-S-cluster containining protein